LGGDVDLGLTNFKLGVIYFRTKNYSIAVRFLRAFASEAALDSPHLFKAYSKLGISYAILGHTDAAVSSLESALKVEPNDYYTLLTLAICKMESQPAVAKVILEKVQNSAYSNVQGGNILYIRSVMHYKNGNLDKTLRLITTAINLCPDNATFHCVAGVYLGS
jgi:tetratricopeptide (TPR) repeat protein